MPETPQATAVVLDEKRRIALKNFTLAYFPSRGLSADKHLEWAIKFFGEERLFRHVSRMDSNGNVYVQAYSNRGHTNNFNACCGYGEMEVGGRTAEIMKDCLAYAWVQRKVGVIASISIQQINQLPVLKEVGFRVVQDWHVNPNSGNKIMLLLFTFPQEEITSAKAA